MDFVKRYAELIMDYEDSDRKDKCLREEIDMLYCELIGIVNSDKKNAMDNLYSWINRDADKCPNL